MPNTIQASNVTLQLREAGTTGSYLNVVCETTNSVTGNANVNTTITKCGPITTVSDPSYTWSVEGVAETNPTAGQVSLEQLLAWFNSKTKLDILYQDPEGTGTNFHIEGEGYITEFGITSNAEGAVTFTASLQLSGAADIIP